VTTADRLGTLVYWRNLGQSWSEMFRGSFTASGFVTAAAAWLGMSKSGALLLGLASTFFWPTLAILCGYGVWRWRVIHAQLERERDNTPATAEQLALLREIAKNTGHLSGYVVRPDNTGYLLGVNGVTKLQPVQTNGDEA
jgi:hypothetical protein